MKVVVPGGTGQVGGVLRRALAARGDEVVVLSRRPEQLEPGVRHVVWDGRTLGPWAAELDGADAVVNLAGRTVSCRYNDRNLRQMMDSRVDSTRVVGEAITRAAAAAVGVAADEHRDDLRRRAEPAGRRRARREQRRSSAGRSRTCRCTGSTACGSPAGGSRHRPTPHVPGTRTVALRTAMVMTPRPGRGLRLPVLAGPPRARRPGRGRAAVRLVDPRRRLRPGRAAPARPGRPRRAVHPRRAGPRPAARADAGAPRRLGPPVRPAGDPADGRGRRAGAADRHRAAAQEPPGGARPAAAAGFTFEHPRWDAAAADLAGRARAASA